MLSFATNFRPNFSLIHTHIYIYISKRTLTKQKSKIFAAQDKVLRPFLKIGDRTKGLDSSLRIAALMLFFKSAFELTWSWTFFHRMTQKTSRPTFTMRLSVSILLCLVLSIGTRQDVTLDWRSAKPSLEKVIASLGPRLIQDNGKRDWFLKRGNFFLMVEWDHCHDLSAWF